MSLNQSIPYGKHQISDSDIDAVVSVLKSDFLTVFRVEITHVLLLLFVWQRPTVKDVVIFCLTSCPTGFILGFTRFHFCENVGATWSVYIRLVPVFFNRNIALLANL